MSLLEIIEVDSSAIEKLVYDDTTLFIKFIDNGWYRYRNFPNALFAEFRIASSKGAFLNRLIKPYFKGEPCASPVP